MATTAVERQAILKSYSQEIKTKNAGSLALEENNNLKMLHMNAPLGDWKEWSTLTYDHNVLANMLLTENEELRKIKEELKKKIKMLSPQAPGPGPFGPVPFPAHLVPPAQPQSLVLKGEDTKPE